MKNWNIKDFFYLLSMIIPVMLFCCTGPCLYAGFSVTKTIIISVIGLIISLVIGLIVENKTTKE